MGKKMMHNVKNSTPKKQVFRHFETGEQLRKLHRGFPSDVSRLFLGLADIMILMTITKFQTFFPLLD